MAIAANGNMVAIEQKTAYVGGSLKNKNTTIVP
jgi:hypothetical protein